MKRSFLRPILYALLGSALALSACTDFGVHEWLPHRETIKVWFVRPESQGDRLVSVSREAPPGNKLECAVSELLNGPTASEAKSGLASEIPAGTILLGIRTEGDSSELNLSRRFASGGGASSMEIRLEQLKRTVAGVAGNRKVYLDVEGQRLSESAGEGLEVPQPINQ